MTPFSLPLVVSLSDRLARWPRNFGQHHPVLHRFFFVFSSFSFSFPLSSFSVVSFSGAVLILFSAVCIFGSVMWRHGKSGGGLFLETIFGGLLFLLCGAVSGEKGGEGGWAKEEHGGDWRNFLTVLIVLVRCLSVLCAFSRLQELRRQWVV